MMDHALVALQFALKKMVVLPILLLDALMEFASTITKKNVLYQHALLNLLLSVSQGYA